MTGKIYLLVQGMQEAFSAFSKFPAGFSKKGTSSGMKADAELDITGDSCPMTFVRTKVKLESMRPGELLCVRLRGGEPLANVPRAVLDHGHTVRRTEALADEVYALWIEVKA
jgi:tRNA 2-thiouridine synthesizing protein A